MRRFSCTGSRWDEAWGESQAIDRAGGRKVRFGRDGVESAEGGGASSEQVPASARGRGDGRSRTDGPCDMAASVAVTERVAVADMSVADRRRSRAVRVHAQTEAATTPAQPRLADGARRPPPKRGGPRPAASLRARGRRRAAPRPRRGAARGGAAPSRRRAGQRPASQLRLFVCSAAPQRWGHSLLQLNSAGVTLFHSSTALGPLSSTAQQRRGHSLLQLNSAGVTAPGDASRGRAAPRLRPAGGRQEPAPQPGPGPHLRRQVRPPRGAGACPRPAARPSPSHRSLPRVWQRVPAPARPRPPSKPRAPRIAPGSTGPEIPAC